MLLIGERNFAGDVVDVVNVDVVDVDVVDVDVVCRGFLCLGFVLFDAVWFLVLLVFAHGYLWPLVIILLMIILNSRLWVVLSFCFHGLSDGPRSCCVHYGWCRRGVEKSKSVFQWVVCAF